IDDVRLSSTLRKIEGVPAGPLPLDLETGGLWRFDNADAADVDPAWTPRPAMDASEPWERETDKDWIDARFQKMDTGPYLNATFACPGPRGKVHAFKGTAIRVGDKGEAAVLFDRARLRLAAGWAGGYLTHSSVRFGLLNTPTPAGTLVFTTESGAGWADPDGKWEDRHAATAPLPREWARYRGLYLHGKHVLLSYTVGNVAVLESPWAESAGGITAITRSLEIGPSDHPLRLLVCRPPAGGGTRSGAPSRMLTTGHGDARMTVGLLTSANGPSLERTADGNVELRVPARKETLRLKLLLWQGELKNTQRFAALLGASPAPPNLSAWTKPGPARWTRPITTRGQVAKDNAPFVIDTLTVPYDNPHNALMFISGIDFLPNGDPVVCTAHGDVWIVKGADDKLEKLTWKRFATGLYQPLGLKVVDGVVHVLERGQLTRLHDIDGDGEADFYECLSNDWHTGGGEHSFDTCLETDRQGNFYFFKTG